MPEPSATAVSTLSRRQMVRTAALGVAVAVAVAIGGTIFPAWAPSGSASRP
jgi:nitrous oxide reductase